MAGAIDGVIQSRSEERRGGGVVGVGGPLSWSATSTILLNTIFRILSFTYIGTYPWMLLLGSAGPIVGSTPSALFACCSLRMCSTMCGQGTREVKHRVRSSIV